MTVMSNSPYDSDPCDDWPAGMFGYTLPWDVLKAHFELAKWRAGVGEPITKAWDLSGYGK